MKWRFSTFEKLSGEAEKGDLCWLQELITVFESDDHNHYTQPNITFVIRENEQFIVLEAKEKAVKVLHPRMGVGFISCFVQLRVLHSSEYIGAE